MLSKHPLPPVDRRPFPDWEDNSLLIDSQELITAIKSFPSGSSGGIDGLTPPHLKDLINESDVGGHFVTSSTDFVNVLLSGVCPEEIRPVFFGRRLLALAKKDGGLRPIAVGMVWRRLASQCANSYAIRVTKPIFSPRQVGVGVPGGAEASVHAARRFIGSMSPDIYFYKLDFKNAFNSLRRDVMLEAVKREVPEILNFCRLAYADVSHLVYEDQLILSSEGSQQGDPLGPLLFCLALQPLINCLESDLVLGYLDDVSGGGDLLTVARDVSMVEEYGAALGLSLNRSKCELIALAPPAVLPKSLEGFRLVAPSDAELLGAPILDGTAMDRILEKKLNDLQRAADRMDLIASHDALVILRYSLGSTKLQYILRASPCASHPSLSRFDALQRSIGKHCKL